jgi:hypothetical protein
MLLPTLLPRRDDMTDIDRARLAAQFDDPEVNEIVTDFLYDELDMGGASERRTAALMAFVRDLVIERAS